MEQNKRGRKRLGNKKRFHNVMLRFNDTEYDKLRLICESYHLDISKRGVVSPLLRRLVLQSISEEKDRLPDTSNLAYQINKIGNNINQLVKIAHHKNLRSPNSSLQNEIQKTNELLCTLLKITMVEKPA
ncbi:plasmid mobilization relaxosome protein MobC [Maribacter litopenaei]|uniref:Plasmid mobilization relaxosome protein MobC n=1 Tax=Maribacter litopenaei TaxID=2976127 RepID=A0ABY5Y8K9_9FLAO|nr:plasmid mobilization relaxosome protein MobC [Maribacter litopenaei]UWX55361.1 plasmid mobilization relaxosome protein MobC [Maribacter litopenaei]